MPSVWTTSYEHVNVMLKWPSHEHINVMLKLTQQQAITYGIFLGVSGLFWGFSYQLGNKICSWMIEKIVPQKPLIELD